MNFDPKSSQSSYFVREGRAWLKTKLSDFFLSCPQGTEGVPEVISTLDAYDLLREDWDAIVELGHYKGRPEVTSLIPSKVCVCVCVCGCGCGCKG